MDFLRSLGVATTSLIPQPQTLLQLPTLSSLWLSSIPPSTNQACTSPQLSCPSKLPSPINTCCLNYPSGHFLQTQFWDTSPSIGPEDSWTIHGLWPDLCTGGFDQFCDNRRSHEDIRGILEASGADDLLDYMSTYWLANDGNDERLWAHEWNKHGTCISTLESSCYSSADHPNTDVLDYFSHTTALFGVLDTYSALATMNILPSRRQTWSLEELQTPLEYLHGLPVTLRCNHRGELDEVWYHFSVLGSLRNASGSSQSPFVPAAPDGQVSNCPSKGIKYLPKSGKAAPPRPTFTSSIPRTSSTTSAVPTSTASPFSGRGNLRVYHDGQSQGCLIRAGVWYTSGGCATYLAKADVVDTKKQQLFTLSSSYAPCSVDTETSAFHCAKDLGIQSIFSSAVDDRNLLAYQNRTSFYADQVPGRFQKVSIYTKNDDEEHDVQLEIRWEDID